MGRRREGNVVDVMVELVEYCGRTVLGRKNPRGCHAGGRRRVCDVRRRFAQGASGRESGENGGSVGGGGGGLFPTECAPHSGRMGGATRPAVMGAQPWVIEKKRMWESQALRAYVRSTMDYPLWVSGVSIGRKGTPSRQGVQGT